MGTVRYLCDRRLGVARCVLSLGHDGDCNPYPSPNEHKTLAAMFAGTRRFICMDASDVAQAAKWLNSGDTVSVPSGTVLPKGWMVPNVTYEVR